MYGDASYAETAFGEGVGLAAPIIPEVGVETRQLIYAIELELISVGVVATTPGPSPVPFSAAVAFDAVSKASRRVTAGFDAFGQGTVVPGADIFWLAPAPAGNDTNLGTNASPWRTFAKADSMVGPGDTVILKSGIYQEADILLETSGTSGNPITYQSEVRHGAIIKPIDNQAGLEVILGDADYIILDGLQVDGTVYPELLGGITMQGSHTETKNCWIHHIRCLGQTDGGSGYLCGNGPTAAYDQVDNRIYNCRVNDIGDIVNATALVHGIYLSHVDAQCYNNLVYRIEGGGIHLWHRASSIMIHNNTLFDCGDSGLILGHGTEPEAPVSLQSTKVSNNIVIDCPFGIRSSGAQGTGNEARNNTCFQCGTAFSLGANWAVSGSATTNPGMVNYQISGAGDYHLTATGAAVNSGISTWAPAFDYDNVVRPKGAGFDRGCYETSLGISTIAASFDAVGTSASVIVPGLIDFGASNTSRRYTIPAATVLNMGTDAWAWGVWTDINTNAGTLFQYILSSGLTGATPSLNWYFVEASATAETPNTCAIQLVDNAGVATPGVQNSSVANTGDGIQRLIILQSTGTTVEMWFCPINGTPLRVLNLAVNLGAITASGPWSFGSRSDANTSRFMENWLGGLFRSAVALTSPQIQTLGTGASPVSVLGANCTAFWPFANGAQPTELDVVGGIVATRQGTGWAAPPVTTTLWTDNTIFTDGTQWIS